MLAQGWERAFGDQDKDGLYDILSTSDGGNLSVGQSEVTLSFQNTQNQLYLLKTDAGGFEDWTSLISLSNTDLYGRSIKATSDGGYIVGGTAKTDGVYNGVIVKTDHLGLLEWHFISPQDSVFGRTILELQDGSYMLTGSTYDGLNYDFYQLRVDEDGNFIQEEQYGGGLYDDCNDAVLTNEGDVIMAGFTNSQGAGNYDVFLIKIDEDGNEIWRRTHGTPNAELAHAITKNSNGDFMVAGQEESLTSDGEDVFLSKIDSDGDAIWWRSVQKEGSQVAYDIQQGYLGGYIMTGYHQEGSGSDRQAILIRAYPDGSFHWMNQYGGSGGDVGWAIDDVIDSIYVVAGNTYSFGHGGMDGYLLSSKFDGVVHSSRVMGDVYVNHNESCEPEEVGDAIANILVEIAGDDITYYGTTDQEGVYDVPVMAGDYNVRLVNPSPLWDHCEDSIDVTLLGNYDTAFVDYSIHPDTLCPYMRVDLSTLTMTKCFQNIYTVNYCNLGTVDADPAEIEVEFDPYLIIDSTSIPWVSNTGNTYTFDVGYLSIFECGSFNVYFTVDCDSTVLGQTHCSEAKIYPNDLCVDANPNWDESSVELNAVCEGDSVHFTIVNYGVGDMNTPLGFIVIEDFIVGMQGDFLLNSGEDTTFTLPANGSTWRLEADQSDGHPGISKPCVTVEGCGTDDFEVGHVVQYPLNDADPFVDTDCRENTGSYDPNDKQGFPTGYGDKNFIEANTDIEYLIRFQNTGTDVARTVVIRDTLSQFLNPTSIEIGGASHEFRYELYGDGILKFIFDDIMLPDSNANEPASHGFVKFRIKQELDLDIFTEIYNSAAIYFDFNEPIITNTTLHTIGKNFIKVDIVGNSNNYGSDFLPWVHIYPNPFIKEATFELKNFTGNKHLFQLVDVHGKTVSSTEFQGNSFQFNRGELPSGIYFFKIMDQELVVSSGKIVVR